MSVPASQMIPKLHYDNAGNTYVCDHLGLWKLHPGIAQVLTQVQQSKDSHMSQVYGRHAAVPCMYGLTTPANFLQSHLSSPPSPSESCLLPPSTYQDPAHILLPDLPDRDLLEPVVITKSHGYAPATKVGGAHHKATRSIKSRWKDKENTGLHSANHPQKHAHAIEANKDYRRTKCGWPNGSNNYSTADIKALLDFVEDAIMAVLSVKTMKPMGNRVCPPDITCAHELDALINEHAGTHDLNDLDHNTYDNELNCNEQPIKTDTHMLCRRDAAASELLSHISGAFDPAVQQARDDDHATRSLANMQLPAQGQQLSDANGTRLYEAKPEHDLTQLCLEMTQMQQPPPNKAAHKTHHQCKPKQADYTYYPNGSQCDTPASDASDHRPSSSQYTHPTPPPFNSTPSPCFVHHRWASRPHLHGGLQCNSRIICSSRKETEVCTDLKSVAMDDVDDLPASSLSDTRGVIA
ncbi:uncharacterized protein EDB93DRAFT_1254437 [Suillus bovinus]|uniref:uncharacterized protein n=1 Tax=Suillus bovinus TaxID=48563 RepID=UPI001B87AF23|nr:uncharacterized protein EDB93DRAFT_1254437 [Suillus bovinus]KAG2134546.1 hypothetical protein EDB93DRAFT_1254437 [Suillus bovinus]